MNIIYVKGPSGSGKSTLISRLTKSLKDKGYSVEHAECLKQFHRLRANCDFVFIETIENKSSIVFADKNLGLMDLINAIDGIKDRIEAIGITKEPSII